MANSAKEQSQADIDAVRRLAQVGETNLSRPERHQPCNDTFPRLETLLVEIDSLKEEARTDRAAAEVARKKLRAAHIQQDAVNVLAEERQSRIEAQRR